MKRLILMFLVVAAVAFTNCKKETTCQVVNKSGVTLSEVTIWEFNSNGDLMDAGHVGNLADGEKTKAFPMSNAAVAVKVGFNNGSEMRYTAKKALSDGEKTVVEMTANTPTTNDLYD